VSEWDIVSEISWVRYREWVSEWDIVRYREWMRWTEQEDSFVWERWGLVQGAKICEQSKLWWNGAIQLIGIQFSVNHISISEWVSEWNRSRRLLCMAAIPMIEDWRWGLVVQELKRAERSKLWWNSSRQLIAVQVAGHHINEINHISISKSISEWVKWIKETPLYDSDGGDEVSSYSCWSFVSNPISDGMVPISWLSFK